MRVFHNFIFDFLKEPIDSCLAPFYDPAAIMSAIEANLRYIRQCANFVQSDFKNANEQLKLLKSLRKTTMDMIEAEQKLIDQQVAIAEGAAAVKKWKEDWKREHPNDPIGPLEEFRQIHSDMVKAVLEERRKENKKSTDSNPDLQYIDKLILQAEAAKKTGEHKSPKPSGSASASAELEMLSSVHDLNIIDPITKLTMSDPVRHTLCGHVYDRDSIKQMIKKHGRKGFRCPYMGCSVRDAITENNLEPALDYQEEIKRRNEKVSRPYNPSKFPN
ncbi:E3 SUMO-protein ligase NSE2 isoform X2 [Hyalella azteca]|uniref:E3 SUMO-protein ligase NSE2 n=1 Tax=Hyalella azteca TaxID=294128 RepID=A0A8B7PK12_HYAAZ|nr:E3 SUMO-protein ligase NSE2 isoform X1 [Hyalella azteca]XP_018025712.1 E3 SUMO-protein ligase NSE2 isoform X2 [Hyalella azteca]